MKEKELALQEHKFEWEKGEAFIAKKHAKDKELDADKENSAYNSWRKKSSGEPMKPPQQNLPPRFAKPSSLLWSPVASPLLRLKSILQCWRCKSIRILYLNLVNKIGSEMQSYASKLIKRVVQVSPGAH